MSDKRLPQRTSAKAEIAGTKNQKSREITLDRAAKWGRMRVLVENEEELSEELKSETRERRREFVGMTKSR